MTHRSRDLRALLATFDALDRYAYEHKRALTLPLVREWLQRRLGE
jgi:chromosomal replication initiation ATPase DnaA